MSPKLPSSVWDQPYGYGLVSRGFHWLMAGLFAVQFLSAILHVIERKMALTEVLWAAHASVGFTLLVLVILRAVWGLLNIGRRPLHGKGFLGLASLGGHIAMYGLMISIPAVAVLRAFGGGRGFSVFGIELFQPGERNALLMAPARLLHGPAGWALLALVAGHVVMVFVHRYAWREDILGRMTRGRQDDGALLVERRETVAAE